MGLDILVVRGKSEVWPVYDAIENKLEDLRCMIPENEDMEVRARRNRLERAVVHALDRCQERLRLPFPSGWSGGYIARGCQIYDTPLYEKGHLHEIFFFYGDRFIPQNWHEVQRESVRIIEIYNIDRYKNNNYQEREMLKILKNINNMSK